MKRDDECEAMRAKVIFVTLVGHEDHRHTGIHSDPSCGPEDWFEALVCLIAAWRARFHRDREWLVSDMPELENATDDEVFGGVLHAVVTEARRRHDKDSGVTRDDEVVQ